MLTKLWTGLWLFFLCVSVVAYVHAYMHEKDFHPYRNFLCGFRRLSWGRRLAVIAAVGVLWVYASTKPDDDGSGGDDGGDGTNNVPQMVQRPGSVNGANVGMLPISIFNSNVYSAVSQADQLRIGNTGTGNTSTLAAFEITSTNTTRTLTSDDFERGFVMTRIGTGEQFDFSPPSNAVVCTDWQGFGGTSDWIYLSFADWVFRLGENDVRRFRIHQHGSAVAAVTNALGAISADNWFSPLKATIGIAKDSNWILLPEESRPSQFWHAVTPDNRLLVTWQNVLLDRATDKPVSFQIEFYPGGRFTYRYDLSRLDADAVTNILTGASFAGNVWETNSIPTNVTSMSFHPLSEEDIYNPDPDNDGLATIDELFVYNTDPRNADSDFDGLNDYDELFTHGTDPLDPHSLGSAYSDGFAVALGGLDPFSFPEGSTNTVLEHIFYSGTTNGAFAYPQSTDSLAILEVSVSGSGTGDLVVGSQVVPLIAPPAQQQMPQNLPADRPRLMGASPSSAHPPLLVQLVKGETYPLFIRGDELLEVSLNSVDFAFGVLPTYNSFGHINFPNTVAETPCIHDFNARRKVVSLPMSRDAQLLTAAWSSASDGVTVSNIPPRSTAVTGSFSARQTRSITYTLSHPEYLFGQTEYRQSVRFCPRPPDPDPDDPEAEDDPDWYDSGDGDDSDETDDDHDERWCCYWGACDGWCGCGCDCGGGSGAPLPGEEDLDEECPEHSMSYDDCAYLHEDDYTNAVQNIQHLGGVLYIREPPFYEQIHLDVPTEHRNCCPCPDHWTNYVGVAYKSYRLRLIDSNGMDFSKTETSCDVNLAGVYPSSAVGDATLAFSRNGEIYQQHNKTVLGVAIKGDYDVDLADYNALNSSFGYPMTVCTNLWGAPLVRLVTNVKLPEGKVHIELANATGQFTLWYYDNTTWEYRKLLDTATGSVKDLSMAYWKALMKRAAYGGTSELPIYITSSTPGHVSLIFRYWNVIEGKFVQDQAVQRITSLRPPLRLDISRDGAIDDGDSAAWFDGQTFYYWINECKIYGDYIVPNMEYTVRNTSDLVVNGTFDLVNLFPVALDLSKFTEAWQNRVTYTLYPEWENTNSFNFCFADVPWSQAGSIQTTNVTTLAGQALSSASLTSLPKTGYQLHYYDTLTQFSENSGLLICEAKSRYASMRLDIKVGDTLLYSYSVPMTILPVKEMYSWYNFRSLSGENAGRETTLRSHPEAYTKSLIFLHGANVSSENAEQWGDVIFKRMWLSGARARFYNVDWRSNIGASANYHENASNAFVVASQIASTINSIPGEKVIMAHSLGNMVVSSMIQDYGLQVSKYIMCNSAVPAEAYDTSLSPTNVLVHKDWNEYPRKAFANEWYKCFEEDVGDDRQLLTWGGRFADVADYAVNFYSTGDHVLELERNNNVWAIDGYENWDQMFEHYSWHKQELWKGRKGIVARTGTTDWAGWGIRENVLGYNTIQPTNAWLMSLSELKTNTVFKLQPESMNTNSIPLLLRGAHLAKGIPARTPASGALRWGDDDNMSMYMFDLNDITPTAKITRPNCWIARPNGLFDDWGNRWLHSDIKDMAYFYVFKFFEKVKETGGIE